MEPLSKEELESWKLDPTTKKVHRKVFAVIQDIKDEWATGKFVDSLVEAHQRGRILGLVEIFEIEPDE